MRYFLFIILYVLSFSASIAQDTSDWLQVVESGSLGDIKKFISNGVDVNVKGGYMDETALMKACSKGHLEVVKALLAHQADVNVKNIYGHTALMIASWQNNLELVKLLIYNNAEINAKDNKGNTALMWTGGEKYESDEIDVDEIEDRIKGHLKVAKYLITNGADMKNVGELLMHATKYGDLEMVKSLVDYGADVNAKDKYGQTALMIASKVPHPEIVKFLKSKGANDE